MPADKLHDGYDYQFILIIEYKVLECAWKTQIITNILQVIW